MVESSAGTNIMPERFTETLRAASEPGWSHAVGHRFVKELFTGAMPDEVMARYLIQDHRFLDSFLTLLGAVLASADTFAARLRFGRFIGMMSSEENTYFLRAFEALGVPEARRAADPDTEATADFKAIMREAGGDAQLCCRAFSPRCGRVALSRLGLPRAEAAAGQLCARRVDHTARQSGFFAASSISCARSWTGSAPHKRICAATSSVELSPSNSPSSKPSK
jgi:hypothetical protein